jgi:hypothetical protein
VEDRDSLERTIVSTFVRKEYQPRALAFVGNPRKREKLLHELTDLRRLDGRFFTHVPSSLQTSAGIYDLLAKAHAPADCYLISENRDWDGTRRPLAQALALVIGQGFATLLACRPDSLAYYEGEAPSLRVILSTGGTATRR